MLPSFLAPLDRAIPMVATADIGRAAAEALREDWAGQRTIALQGPAAYSPDDVAAAFARALGRPVQAVAVPEAGWAEALSHGGFSARSVAGFTEMMRGLNGGHIDFAQRSGGRAAPGPGADRHRRRRAGAGGGLSAEGEGRGPSPADHFSAERSTAAAYVCFASAGASPVTVTRKRLSTSICSSPCSVSTAC